MQSTELYAPVGAIVSSTDAGEHYTVLAHNPDGSVTVRWLGDGSGAEQGPRTVTHHAALDPRDEILGIRQRLILYTGDHSARLADRLSGV